uniref:Carboxylic ester hydrolase n=1 Tax=Moniliophthora roreri TaxID=221103 RepID=A0A0W0F2A9_MONRR
MSTGQGTQFSLFYGIERGLFEVEGCSTCGCGSEELASGHGSLYTGSINEPINDPESLVAQSVSNGLPVLYVAMNYRLNIFGFAVSDALRANHSLNIGLKDQRLALEWIRESISYFGGDPGRVTIFGQSSGIDLRCSNLTFMIYTGLSVAMQIFAYANITTKPKLFHSAVMQSTSLEPNITSDISATTFKAVAKLANCSSSTSSVELECLRALPFEKLLNVTISQYQSVGVNDAYLPVVDGDFLPLAPSNMTRRGLFPKMPVIMGWTEDDGTLLMPTSTNSTTDTENYVRQRWTGLTNSSLTTLFSLYPSSDFQPGSTNLSAEFYLTWPGSTCYEPPIYHYNQNQTVLSSLFGPDLRITHLSEIPYVFGFNFWTLAGIRPNASDVNLHERESRSWSTFANIGKPSSPLANRTLEGWAPAYNASGTRNPAIYVIGGPRAGMMEADSKLMERCAFLNRDDIIFQLRY